MSKDTQTLAEVARLYYELDLTQQEIAERLYTSRSRVSRLIKQAKAEGVVEITIHYPQGRQKSLEDELRVRFPGLDACIVDCEGHPPAEALLMAARLAAAYIGPLLTEETVLGLTWGSSVYSVVRELRPAASLPGMQVVQLTGAVESPNPAMDSPDLVRATAAAYGCRYHYLLVPLFVEDAHTKNNLIKRDSIRENLAIAQRAQVICTGIGCHRNWQRYVPREVGHELEACEAAGYICGYYYDVNGQFVADHLRDRIISVERDIFTTAPYRLGIGLGADKSAAILGALRGGLINVLITDAATAAQVLQLAKGSR